MYLEPLEELVEIEYFPVSERYCLTARVGQTCQMHFSALRCWAVTQYLSERKCHCVHRATVLQCFCLLFRSQRPSDECACDFRIQAFIVHDPFQLVFEATTAFSI